uniref:Uncharacterized protein n=1 Tax=Cacopsylla melanoneura TaxID=428564 RepID=A0A8D9B4M2_9HEMI
MKAKCTIPIHIFIKSGTDKFFGLRIVLQKSFRISPLHTYFFVKGIKTNLDHRADEKFTLNFIFFSYPYSFLSSMYPFPCRFLPFNLPLTVVYLDTYHSQ